jgi:hypothetical protein
VVVSGWLSTPFSLTRFLEKENESPTFLVHFGDKKTAVKLDYAPARNQTEGRVIEHNNVVPLRLSPFPDLQPDWGLLQRPAGSKQDGPGVVARRMGGNSVSRPNSRGPQADFGARCQVMHLLYGPSFGEQDAIILSECCCGI